MLRIRQIINAINKLDGKSFEEFCDEVLCLERKNNGIFSLGLSKKYYSTKKGTPDSYFFETESSNFTFIEYTVTQTSIDSKFKKDITKCLKNIKNSHPPMQVKEIIFCYSTNDLLPETSNELNILCTAHNITLSVYNADKLAYILIENKANRIIKGYLNLAYNTEQIKTFKEFIDTNKPIPLSENTLYREKESQELTKLFEQNDLIVLSGQSGIGKTQFACTFAKDYSINNDLHLFCLRSNKAPILDEILELDVNNSYFFLIDDANDFVELEGIIKIIDRIPNSKILLTIRDYLINNLSVDITIKYTSYKLYPLLESQIISILSMEQFSLTYNQQKELIKLINGNIRLGLFIKESLPNNDEFYNIHNVFNIFQKYYSNFIKKFINSHETEKTKTILSIIAIFRYINLNDDKFINLINQNYNINLSEHQETLHLLVNEEVLNSYENIYKISDQNIQNLILYCLFNEKRNTFIHNLLKLFFDGFAKEVSEHIYTIINIFRNPQDKEIIISQLQQYWEEIKSSNNINLKWQFIQCFHSFLELETIIFIKEESNNNLSQQHLTIIGMFFSDVTDSQHRVTVLSLFFDLILKIQQDYSKILYYILNNDYLLYGIFNEKTSEQTDFITIFEEHLTTNNDSLILKSAFMEVAKFILKNLPKLDYGNEHHKKMREKAWSLLIKYGDNNISEIYEILMALPYFHDHKGYIRKLDTPYLHQLLEKYFFECNIQNIILIYHIHKLFRISLSDCHFFKNYLSNIKFQIYTKIRQFKKINSRYYTQTHSNLSITSAMSINTLKEVINLIFDIITLSDNNDGVDYSYIITAFFTQLNINDQSYKDIVIYFLKHPLCKIYNNQNTYNFIVEKLNSFIDNDEIKHLFEPYFLENSYLFYAYWNNLSDEYITFNDTIMILDYIKSHLKEHNSEFFLRLSFLNKFTQINNSFYLKVLQIVNILQKINRKFSTDFYYIFEDIINESSQNYLILNDHINLISELYIKTIVESSIVDHNHNAFKFLIDLSPNFIENYIKAICNEKYYNSLYNYKERNTYVLNSSNYINWLNIVFDYLTSIKYETAHDEIALSFLDLMNNEERVKIFLDEFINKNVTNMYKMIKLSYYISKGNKKLILCFFSLFLKYNMKLNDFKELKLLHTSVFSSGSLVPLYIEKKKFLEELLKIIPDNIDFIHHRQYVNEEKKHIENCIKSVKKREFLYDIL